MALHVKVHYYVDKELMANSQQACGRACAVEAEFLCRSYLYLGPPDGADYNCKLYHLDSQTLPEGQGAFSVSNAEVSSKPPAPSVRADTYPILASDDADLMTRGGPGKTV